MDISYRRTPPNLLERALRRLLKGQRNPARSADRLDISLNPGIEFTPSPQTSAH